MASALSTIAAQTLELVSVFTDAKKQNIELGDFFTNACHGLSDIFQKMPANKHNNTSSQPSEQSTQSEHPTYSQDDQFYQDPQFLKALEQLEKNIKDAQQDLDIPSFSLGINSQDTTTQNKSTQTSTPPPPSPTPSPTPSPCHQDLHDSSFHHDEFSPSLEEEIHRLTGEDPPLDDTDNLKFLADLTISNPILQADQVSTSSPPPPPPLESTTILPIPSPSDQFTHSLDAEIHKLTADEEPASTNPTADLTNSNPILQAEQVSTSSPPPPPPLESTTILPIPSPSDQITHSLDAEIHKLTADEEPASTNPTADLTLSNPTLQPEHVSTTSTPPPPLESTTIVAEQVPESSNPLPVIQSTNQLVHEEMHNVANAQKRKHRKITQLPRVLCSPYWTSDMKDRSKIQHKHREITDFALIDGANDNECLFQSGDVFVTRAMAKSMLPGSYVDYQILQAWALELTIRNIRKRIKNPSRVFFSPVVNMPLQPEVLVGPKEGISTEKREEEFFHVIETEMKNGEIKDITKVDLVFFCIYRYEHFYVIVFNNKKNEVVVLDNMPLGDKKPNTKYGKLPSNLKTAFSKFMKSKGCKKSIASYTIKYPKLVWQDESNTTDCAIFTMQHMHSYKGEDGVDWDETLKESITDKDKLADLRLLFLSRILDSDKNELRQLIRDKAELFYKKQKQ